MHHFTFLLYWTQQSILQILLKGKKRTYTKKKERIKIKYCLTTQFVFINADSRKSANLALYRLSYPMVMIDILGNFSWFEIYILNSPWHGFNFKILQFFKSLKFSFPHNSTLKKISKQQWLMRGPLNSDDLVL